MSYNIDVDLIRKYYANKVSEYGMTSKGVDWSNKLDQLRRFDVLLDGFQRKSFKSILDFGCGTGDLAEHLIDIGIEVEYTGYDVSPEMIDICKTRFLSSNGVSFTSDIEKLNSYDLVVASGILNVKLNTSIVEWKRYVLKLIDLFQNLSIKGFSFNCLSSYSDLDKQESRLYYGDPLEYFDYCKNNISKNVALIHDYGMYEWTMIIKK